MGPLLNVIFAGALILQRTVFGPATDHSTPNPTGDDTPSPDRPTTEHDAT